MPTTEYALRMTYIHTYICMYVRIRMYIWFCGIICNCFEFREACTIYLQFVEYNVLQFVYIVYVAYVRMLLVLFCCFNQILVC